LHHPKPSIPSTPPLDAHSAMPSMEVPDHLRIPSGQSPIAHQQISSISSLVQSTHSPSFQNVTTIQTVQTIQAVPVKVTQPVVHVPLTVIITIRFTNAIKF
jgi:hypothetical protein